MWGSGEQYRDFLYIDDVCDALLLMATKGMNQGVIQIGTGEACRQSPYPCEVSGRGSRVADNPASNVRVEVLFEGH